MTGRWAAALAFGAFTGEAAIGVALAGVVVELAHAALAGVTSVVGARVTIVALLGNAYTIDETGVGDAGIILGALVAIVALRPFRRRVRFAGAGHEALFVLLPRNAGLGDTWVDIDAFLALARLANARFRASVVNGAAVTVLAGHTGHLEVGIAAGVTGRALAAGACFLGAIGDDTVLDIIRLSAFYSR